MGGVKHHIRLAKLALVHCRRHGGIRTFTQWWPKWTHRGDPLQEKFLITRRQLERLKADGIIDRDPVEGNVTVTCLLCDRCPLPCLLHADSYQVVEDLPQGLPCIKTTHNNNIWQTT